MEARACLHADRRPGEDRLTLDGSILAFTGIVALLTILAGADVALVAKVTLLDGRRAAFFTSLGICAGLPVHATASAFGLSLILATSAEAFTVVKRAPRTSRILGFARSATRSGRPPIPRSRWVGHGAAVPPSFRAG